MKRMLLLLFSIFISILIFYRYNFSQKAVSPRVTTNGITSPTGTLDSTAPEFYNETKNDEEQSLQDLTWIDYKNTNLGLSFKYPSNYYSLEEVKTDKDTCIRLGNKLSYSYSICYIYNKTTVDQTLEFYNDPLKYRDYNENNYSGTVTKTMFKGNNALLMVDDSMQQVPSDRILITMNKSKSSDFYLIEITYPKQDIDTYLKHNNEDWGEYLEKYKSMDLEISKILLDSMKF